MSVELIISIISLVGTVIVGIFTALGNIRVNKLNNLEKVHTYEKEIDKFELQFKDEEWLCTTMRTGAYQNYSKRSRKRIVKYFKKYNKQKPLSMKPALGNPILFRMQSKPLNTNQIDSSVLKVLRKLKIKDKDEE